MLLCFLFVIRAVERKYQGKINALQAELAMDRETLTSHAIKQRQSLENELETLRADEAQLRTRVEILQKVKLLCLVCSRGSIRTVSWLEHDCTLFVDHI